MRRVVGLGIVVTALMVTPAAADPCRRACREAHTECLTWSTQKHPGYCSTTFVRCQRACPPAPAPAAAAEPQAAADPLTRCLPDCSLAHDDCIKFSTDKRPGFCSTGFATCKRECELALEQARPAPRVATAEEPRAAVPAPPATDEIAAADRGAAAPQEPPPPVRPPATDAPTAPRPGGVGAAEAARPSGVAAAHPAVASADAAVPAVPAAPPIVPVPPAARARDDEGLLRRIYCALTPFCRTQTAQAEAAPRAPLTCPERCSAEYETCMTRERVKRPGHCQTQAARCKRDCREAAAPASP